MSTSAMLAVRRLSMFPLFQLNSRWTRPQASSLRMRMSAPRHLISLALCGAPPLSFDTFPVADFIASDSLQSAPGITTLNVGIRSAWNMSRTG